ncbi:hypothetical protein Poly30_04380 [Planctomycetes bacterium Poly30]|uniref:Uncharacterized protein n=1 Tax=Saltatorellus ferox TaxID=2528018 RepID=A0A518ELH8_9BACT|nr:hypothetical protein Poly30_04380 [Planctomycetes bacterium Poly30]
MKLALFPIVAGCSLLLASHSFADLTQPEVPDFRGFESTSFLRWNDWNNVTFFQGQPALVEPDVVSDPGASGTILNPIAFLSIPGPGEICSTSNGIEIGYNHSGLGNVEEVVVQIGGLDAALIEGYLLYPDFPDPEALGHIEARDLPGGGKLFRFLASPQGQGYGTYSDFTSFAIRLSLPNSASTLCLDEVQLDVRHELSGAFDTVCNGATVNSLAVRAGMDLGGSSVAADNTLELTASGIPAASFGLFLASRGVGSTPCTGICVGSLCLDPTDVGRIGPALNAGPDLSFERMLDLSNIPTNPPVSAIAGQNWYFQAWYRDVTQGLPVSRFTDAAAILLQ